MSVIQNNLLLTGEDGYNLQNSLRFRSSASAYLNRTPASAGNRQIWTWSGWVKRGALGVYSPLFIAGTTNGQQVGSLAFSSAGGVYDKLELNFGVQGISTEFWLQTTQVFRDPSAWYHIVCSVDTTQATASNRVKFYVNGTQITALGSYGGYSQYPSQNYNTSVNNTVQHLISRDQVNTAGYFDGYITEVNFIDGQALTPSSFGETSPSTGVWIPKKYSGTYGTNGFYLDFKDTSSTTALGYDAAGSNDWTVNNISLTSGSTYDSMTDVPTISATASNYAVLNPLDAQGTATLTDGNLTIASSTTAHKNRKATFILPSSGKWYWELVTASTCSASVILGWGLQTTSAANDSQAGNANTWMAQNDANQDIFNQTTSVLSTGSAVSGGSIRQVAYDADSGKLWFGINNTWYSSSDLTSGNPGSGTNQCMTLSAGDYFQAITCYNLTANANFGQRPFAYTPPSGFVALNTFNLPTPTIGATASTQAGKYFNTVLYTGNGSVGRAVTGVGFKPDFTWIKGRSDADYNYLVDIIRTYPNRLFSNLTDAASTESNTVTSSDSDGFTVGSDAGVNRNNSTYVAWNWKANGAGSTNTAGSITSTVSANTTAGFSIVTYTGTGANATVGHGLGVAPSMVIVKSRSDGSTYWCVYQKAMWETSGTDYTLLLPLTNAAASRPTLFNSTQPSSTVFSIGTNGGVNNNASTYVAYCFAPVAGYSAFGSYTGNGSTDGPFIYLGFRPKYILIKCSSTGGTSYNWALTDSVRSYANVANHTLAANLADASSSFGTGVDVFGPYNQLDLLSNGFKIRDTGVWGNASGATYVYACFAENPFKYSLAR